MVFQDNAETTIPDTHSNVQKLSYSVELSFFQRIKLRLFGNVYVGDCRDEGWSSTLPNYAFRCGKHGLQFGYPTGHSKLLMCPECAPARLHS